MNKHALENTQKNTSNKVSVFAVINTKDGILVTTRPEDKNVPFGLPGGKVDTGEDLKEALIRECFEEGVDIKHISDLLFIKIREEYLDNGIVHWFHILGTPTILEDYKEKYRGIEVTHKTIEEVAVSGYGNSFLLEYFK